MVVMRERRARILSVLLLASTLAAGIMLGLAWSARTPPAALPEPGDPPDPAEVAASDTASARTGGDERRFRAPVIHQVGLNADQRTHVDRIIAHFRAAARTLNREMRARYDREQSALLEATRDSLRAVLREEQIVRYDSLLAVHYGGARDSDRHRQRRRE